MDNYFIKRDYKVNEINITNDKVSDTKYWNKQRNQAAEMYQFPVYEFLSNYIKENKITIIITIYLIVFLIFIFNTFQIEFLLSYHLYL